MNTLVKVGVASALALGYVSAHAGAVVPSSSSPGNIFLFADVISGGNVIDSFAADTTVSVNSATGVSGHLANNQVLFAADSNLTSLLNVLATTPGATLEWAVMGGGGASDASGNLQFVTTANTTATTTAAE
jgi:hypothetical protein